MDTTTLLIIVIIVLLLGGGWYGGGTLVLSSALTGSSKQPGLRRNPAYKCLSFTMENTERFAQVTPPGQSRARPVESKRSRVTCWRAKSIASARS
jgi:hypothetical protein